MDAKIVAPALLLALLALPTPGAAAPSVPIVALHAPFSGHLDRGGVVSRRSAHHSVPGGSR